ncbi:mitochondrial protein required for respiration [Artomyces pyxidatus]|uniref:Mitochondrial protein required for respiration n=1 Tax=Artomyces pyxidatus TaxID=48021 RepID=A0ACB8TIA6_9AGAM|nr:mitochondrial protein required for respiration [Artomyces pyxidatus]
MFARIWAGGPRQSLARRQAFRGTSLKTWTRSQHTGTSPPPQYSARRYSLINPTLVVLGVIPIFTFALGTWQVQRLKWKVGLIDELTEKLEREPIYLPNKVNLSAIPEFIYRKVILRGRWDHAHSMLLGPRVRDSAHGYHLVTPLVRSNGSTVLVDRGFVSEEFAGKLPLTVDEGEVEVCGMLRDSQARNNFTPDNHPEKGEWYWADVDAMAEYAGGESANVQPVLIEEIFDGHAGEAALRSSRGVPIGKVPIVDIRNAHASYVVTWYTLSAFTAFMFVRLLLKQRRSYTRFPR